MTNISAAGAGVRQFQIFKTMSAPLLMQSGVMSVSPLSAETRSGLTEAVQAGYTDGDVVRVVFNIPGFSLTHAWLKADYPLTRHTHNVDCLYYIIAGTLTLGKETLGARDGFFVPANSPYSYRPGSEGVEILEFRHETQFDITILPASRAFWDRAVEACKANKEGWLAALPPMPERLPIPVAATSGG